jgi:hypothetical protein
MESDILSKSQQNIAMLAGGIYPEDQKDRALGLGRSRHDYTVAV